MISLPSGARLFEIRLMIRPGQFDEPRHTNTVGTRRKSRKGSPSMYDFMVASPHRAYTGKELKAWMKEHGMTQTTYRSDKAEARKKLSDHHPLWEIWLASKTSPEAWYDWVGTESKPYHLPFRRPLLILSNQSGPPLVTGMQWKDSEW
jgi:hypothetical protein